MSKNEISYTTKTNMESFQLNVSQFNRVNNTPITNSKNILELIDNISQKLLNNIAIISESKKSFAYRFILTCYDIMNEIEIYINQEKQSLELLIFEKIENEKLIYRYELESIINVLP